MGFTLDTPYGEVIDALRERGACKEAMDFTGRLTDKTVKEVVDASIEHGEPGWIIWNAVVTRDLFDKEVLLYFLRSIKDPMSLVNIWLGVQDLSDEEDAVLEAGMRGKLPEVEKEFVKGSIHKKRKKKNRVLSRQ